MGAVVLGTSGADSRSIVQYNNYLQLLLLLLLWWRGCCGVGDIRGGQPFNSITITFGCCCCGGGVGAVVVLGTSGTDS